MKKGEIKVTDKRYPKLLKKIENPPEKLFYKGEWDEEIFKNCLAVVGSRRMTEYGEKITTKLVSEIAASGITIVSGFMYGIDAIAHKAAVEAGGRTIAVMPCGIEMIHPEYQKKLYEKIINKGGLVISEYPGKYPPAKRTYPERNRIVAGLSKATMVVQAAKKSGSLITAGCAKKYKRKLFAIPGPLTSSVSIGTAKLIKNGASIVTEAKDVIGFYGAKQSLINFGRTGDKSIKENKVERKVVKELQTEPLGIDDISRKLNLSSRETGILLSEMQLKGIIKKEGNKYTLD